MTSEDPLESPKTGHNEETFINTKRFYVEGKMMEEFMVLYVYKLFWVKDIPT